MLPSQHSQIPSPGRTVPRGCAPRPEVVQPRRGFRAPLALPRLAPAGGLFSTEYHRDAVQADEATATAATAAAACDR